MKTRWTIGLLMVVALVAARSLSAADPAPELKCPVSGKAAKTEHAVDFEGGKVYFCCPNCPGAFEKDKEKFAAKARHQMLQSGQLEQVHCPISHKDFNPDQSTDVSGAKVKFCCGNCKGKVEKMSADEAIVACFGKADCFKAAAK